MPAPVLERSTVRELLIEEIPSILRENVEIREILRETIYNQAFRELADAQRTSERRLDRIEHVVGELAEAQKRTEQRVEELAEAQKRTEQKVEELAEAQKRTEQRVEELAEAQKRTEQKVEELAEAQKRTEQELHTLVYEHKETRRQLGGLSATVGYGLEDKAYPALPGLLQKDYGLTIQERPVRRYITDKDGHAIEVNIFGKALREGQEVVVIGESKAQLSKNDVKSFKRKKLRRLEGVFQSIFPVIVTYMITSPDVEDFAREQGIAVYYSYDF